MWSVRRKVCLLMAKIKRALRPSVDVKQQAQLKEALSFLSLDKDRDVIEAALLV